MSDELPSSDLKLRSKRLIRILILRSVVEAKHSTEYANKCGEYVLCVPKSILRIYP